MLAVITEAVDVAAEIGGIAPTTMEALALVTNLIIQNIRFDFNLTGREQIGQYSVVLWVHWDNHGAV